VVEFEQRIRKSTPNGLSDLTLKIIVMLIMIVFMVRTHSLRKAREMRNIMEEAIRMMTLGGVEKEDEDKVEKGRRVRRRVEKFENKVEEVEKIKGKVEKVEGSLCLSDEVREYVVRMVIKRNYSKPRRKLESLGYSKVRIMKRRDKIIVEANGGREIIDVGKYGNLILHM
jgi:hypothetical protein